MLGEQEGSNVSSEVTTVCSVVGAADSDEAAPLFRDDCAPGFRDDLAPCLVGLQAMIVVSSFRRGVKLIWNRSTR
ncbi:hypothetical protein CN225_27980 [Sinorhizobium meliloti]|nr:hypothetical protein CN225_27980 [Sinorhizobium meliloti]